MVSDDGDPRPRSTGSLIDVCAADSASSIAQFSDVLASQPRPGGGQPQDGAVRGRTVAKSGTVGRRTKCRIRARHFNDAIAAQTWRARTLFHAPATSSRPPYFSASRRLEAAKSPRRAPDRH
jgi:hypothetical protein